MMRSLKAPALTLLCLGLAYYGLYWATLTLTYGTVDNGLTAQTTVEYGAMLHPLGPLTMEVSNSTCLTSCDADFEVDQAHFDQNVVDERPTFRISTRPGPGNTTRIEVRTDADHALISKPQAMQAIRQIIAQSLHGIAEARADHAAQLQSEATWRAERIAK